MAQLAFYLLKTATIGHARNLMTCWPSIWPVESPKNLHFNEITTGAQSDLEHATKLARRMVTEYGMSDKLGPRTFGKREELVFLGREITEQRNYSEKVALQIDSEVHDLIQRAYSTAKEIISKNKERLKMIAQELISFETIEEAKFEELMKLPLPGETLEPAPAS